jgi:hypothetical protein
MKRAVTKRITDTKELPSWFDREKYKNDKLDALGWYEQLVIRKYLYLSVIKKNQQSLDHPALPIRRLIKTIRKNPIIDIKSFDYALKNLFTDVYQLKTRNRVYDSSAVHNLQIYELLNLMKSLPKPHYVEAMKCLYDRKRPPGEHFFESIRELTKSKSLHEYVCLDMNAPDTTLISGFKTHLSQLRKKLNSKGHQRLRDPFATWKNNKVLEYLDLHIWEIEYDFHINHAVISKAVFQSKKQAEDNEPLISKKISRIAINAISTANLRRLRSQIP